MTTQLSTRRHGVVYPESDGKPLGETDTHVVETSWSLATLQDHFRDRADVYVAADNLIYFVEGDPKKMVSPDAYVVFGVPKTPPRRVFKVWEEGRAPSFVLEVTSRKTAHHDMGRKLAIYRDELKVPEYFLFDPEGDWVPERLRGHVLGPAGYAEMGRDPRTGRLTSATLGLELGVVGNELRFYVAGAAAPLLRPLENAERARQEAQRADVEAQRADAAEAELARLREELARLRAEGGRP